MRDKLHAAREDRTHGRSRRTALAPHPPAGLPAEHRSGWRRRSAGALARSLSIAADLVRSGGTAPTGGGASARVDFEIHAARTYWCGVPVVLFMELTLGKPKLPVCQFP